jgi:hypothetical protein
MCAGLAGGGAQKKILIPVNVSARCYQSGAGHFSTKPSSKGSDSIRDERQAHHFTLRSGFSHAPKR